MSGGVAEDIRPEVEAYLDLLFRWSGAVGLTAFRDRSEAWAKGVLPSLEGLPFLPPGEGYALDVGSGGGFPAVPLSLARREVRWVLAEPSGRKAAFLKDVARALGLRWEVREETVEAALGAGAGPFQTQTMRGVRLDRRRAAALASGLAPRGRILLWTGTGVEERYRALLARAALTVSEQRLHSPGLTLLVGEKG